MSNIPEQNQIPDLPVVEQMVADAALAVKESRRQLRVATRDTLLCLFRLGVVRAGAPRWLATLVLSSTATIVVSIFLIFAIHVGSELLFGMLMIAYGASGYYVFWLLRDRDGENDDTRLAVRTEKLCAARQRRELVARVNREATTKLQQSLRLLDGLRRAARTEAAIRAAKEQERSLQLARLRLMEQQARFERMTQLLGVNCDGFSGTDFEEYVAAIFEFLGYTTGLTKKSGDQGVDIVATKGGVRLAIQAKCWGASVGNSAVQEVVAGRAHYGCHRCAVVSSSYFTSGAIALAQSNDCLLIAKSEIPRLIKGEFDL